MCPTDQDMVNNPPHYQRHPSHVEIIDIAEQLDYLRGTALAYVARAPHKGTELQDYKKALWYMNRFHDELTGLVPGGGLMADFLEHEPPGSIMSKIIHSDGTVLEDLEKLIAEKEQGVCRHSD
ncbi:MAG: DUF3310 domain-containing protein [Desulfobulbia bacterium]